MMDLERRRALDCVILLLSCAVRKIPPDRTRIAEMDLNLVYEIARFHQVAAAVGMALEDAGCADERFQKAVAQAQRKAILLERDRAAVLSELERAGIRYMLLKGSVLKDEYPRFGMREMTDIDILVDPDRMEDTEKIMLRLGFRPEEKNGSHDAYQKPPVSNFEMHRRLFTPPSDPKLCAWFGHVWDRLIRDPGDSFEYHFSDEDFYLYMIAHEYKHFEANGTGLRSLLDVFVFLRSREPDWEYVSREAAKMGMDDFEKSNRELSLRLFSGEPLNEAQLRMLDEIAASGVYGQYSRRIDKKITQKGRFGYFLSRLTLPYEEMEMIFPVLRKAPVLYPVLWVARFFRGLKPARRKKALMEIKAVLGLSDRRKDSGE